MNTPKKSVAAVKAVAAVLLILLATVMASGRALAETVFSDDFSGNTLNPAWTVLPGFGGDTVGGGNLTYYNDGPVASTTGWYNPALTLSLPFSGTDWEVDTKATYSLAWCNGGNYTGPSTANQGCSAGAQGPEVLVKFAPGVTTSQAYGGLDYAGTDAAIIERVTDAYYGADGLYASYGNVGSANMLNPADSGIVDNIAGGTYYYQIIRNGGVLTINSSSDGVNYDNALTVDLADPAGTYNELLIGGITYSSAGSSTNYDYVDISSTPEPASWALLALGIAVGIALKWRAKSASV